MVLTSLTRSLLHRLSLRDRATQDKDKPKIQPVREPDNLISFASFPESE